MAAARRRSGACCARFRSPRRSTFFREIGVPLHEEPGGKLFPDSDRSRDVLTALLREVGTRRRRAAHRPPRRLAFARERLLSCRDEPGHADRARGSSSRPAGCRCRRPGATAGDTPRRAQLGHTIVPTTPALAPLVLDAAAPRAIHGALSGVALGVRLDVRIGGQSRTDRRRLAALDALRRRAVRRRSTCRGTGCAPGSRATRWPSPPAFVHRTISPRWRRGGWRSRSRAPGLSLADGARRPRSGIRRGRTAAAARDRRRADAGRSHARHSARADARRARWPLAVLDSRGYNYAEVTAGGVPLNEIDPALDAVARLPWPLPGRRDSGRRRAPRRLQLSVGVVHGPDCRRGGRLVLFAPVLLALFVQRRGVTAGDLALLAARGGGGRLPPLGAAHRERRRQLVERVAAAPRALRTILCADERFELPSTGAAAKVVQRHGATGRSATRRRIREWSLRESAHSRCRRSPGWAESPAGACRQPAFLPRPGPTPR